jgi:hypothetical protein
MDLLGLLQTQLYLRIHGDISQKICHMKQAILKALHVNLKIHDATNVQVVGRLFSGVAMA